MFNSACVNNSIHYSEFTYNDYCTFFIFTVDKARQDSMSSVEDGEANIVDRLLGDIKNGFTHKKLGDINDFSVTKVQKVTLDSGLSSPEPAFTRQGSLRGSRRSSLLNRARSFESGSDEDFQKRNRKTANQSTSEDLFDFLQSEDDPEKMDRQGSFRRRRRRANIESLIIDRERAPSPKIGLEPASPLDRTSVSSWRSSGELSDNERPLSGTFERNSSERRSLRSPAPGSNPVTPSTLVRNSPLRSSASRADVLWNRAVETAQANNNANGNSDNVYKSQPELDTISEKSRIREERRKRVEVDKSDVHAAFVKLAGTSNDSSAISNTSENKLNESPEINETEVKVLSKSERRTLHRDRLRSSSALDANELASALKTVEEQSHAKTVSENVDTQASPRNRSVNRIQPTVEPSTVSSVMKIFSENDNNNSSENVAKPLSPLPTINETRVKKVEDSTLVNLNTTPVAPPRTKSAGRRSRSEGDTAQVNQALQNGGDAPLQAWGAGDVNHNQHQDTDMFGSSSLRERLDADMGPTLTEKALLDHHSGRWRSNIDRTDVDEAYEQLKESGDLDWSCNNNDNSLENTNRINEENNNRNQLSNYTGSTPETTSVSSENRSDNDNRKSLDSSVTRRWGRVFDENEANSTFNRQDPRRWSTVVDTRGYKSQINGFQDKIDETDLPHKSLDRNLTSRRSFRVSRLPTDPTTDTISTWRSNMETQKLDENIQNYQSKQSASNNARKQRMKALSQRIALQEDDQWSPRNSAVYENKQENRLAKIQDDLKSDTESVSSGRDEGFETMSENVSQRTSMSSTLSNTIEQEFPPGKELRGKEDEDHHSQPYFAASIDSLVYKPGSQDDIKSSSPAADRTPTNEVSSWSLKSSFGGSSPDTVVRDDEEETWVTETWVTETETKVSELPPEVQKAMGCGTKSPKDNVKERMMSPQTVSGSEQDSGRKQSERLGSRSGRNSSVPSLTSKSSSSGRRSIITKPDTKQSMTKSSLSSSRPKKPSSVSNLRREASNNSLDSDCSGNNVHERLSKPKMPSRMSISSSRENNVTSPTTTSPFVRGSSSRVTMPASLRTTRRSGVTSPVPPPPDRSSSIRPTPSERSKVMSNTPTERIESDPNESIPFSKRRTSSLFKSTSSTESKSTTSISRLMNKIGTSKSKENVTAKNLITPKPTKTRTPDSGSGGLSARISNTVDRLSRPSKTASTPSLKEESPVKKSSIIKKLTSVGKPVDKSPYRKSDLNKADIPEIPPPATRKPRMSVNKITLKASRC